ncbi:beta-mannosidase [bacterium]|nr:beta-mannosidase [bacterium]
MPDPMHLNDNWQVRWADISWGPEKAAEILHLQDNWLPCSLPCDVHTPLITANIIPEPLEADHSFASNWIEEKSWWFKTTFTLTQKHLSFQRLELFLESLDAEADVFLNDVHIGHHRSAFYPFTSDIKAQAKTGINTLLIRLTTGVERFGEDTPEGIKAFTCIEENSPQGRRGDRRRIFVRKPQYVFGWDWAPRVPSCGIMGKAELKFHNIFIFHSVQARTHSIDPSAALTFSCEIENLETYATREAAILIQVYENDHCVLRLEKMACLRSGLNSIDLEGTLSCPKLWWPQGMGEQFLYHIKAYVQCDIPFFPTEPIAYPGFAYGIRTLQLDLSQVNLNERLFTFVINGQRIFCKGANWIPADSIYARVTSQTYETLVKEAATANFNMLRVWGGGRYEPDLFYHLCDQNGILLWQDFMFSCALYPDHEPWFVEEVKRELDYQTKRLRNHPSLALWCGNNKNHWLFSQRLKDKGQPFGGAFIYNILAPETIRKSNPDIPYWNSSPFGGDTPNALEIGDQHYWHDGMLHKEMEKRITPEIYDTITAKFISECGYIGPARKESIQKYFGQHSITLQDPIWNLHNNTFEKKTVLAGIHKHYADTRHLSLDEYLLYAGLCQGLMLGYSLEALRFKEPCSGVLFWMYNDTWGENGWSIMDYYHARKIAYYFVKRAFEPIKFILRTVNGIIRVTGFNETPNNQQITLEYGSLAFSGKNRRTETKSIVIKPHGHRIVLEFPLSGIDPSRHFYFVLPNNNFSPALLRQNVFRTQAHTPPNLTIDNVEIKNAHAVFTITTDVFAHAVHFNLNPEIVLSDEYFDLLPGQMKIITLSNVPSMFSSKQIMPKSVFLTKK